MKYIKKNICFLLFLFVTFFMFKIAIRESKFSFIQSNESYEEIKERKVKAFAILEIPKIKLIKELYNIDSKYNNVNYGIEILKDSKMPDVKGSFILASHSGNSKISYFKNLDDVYIDDEVNVYYENKKYVYKINEVYNIEKTGKLIVENIYERNIYLITCNKRNKNLQTVLFGKLIEVN